MGGHLRKATNSQSITMGPFVDDTDFKTLRTSLTILNTDVKLTINGGVTVNKNFGGGTHRVNGFYRFLFNDDDTAEVGEMHVSIKMTGAIVVWDKFYVVEPAVYDALYAPGALGFANVVNQGDSVVVITNIENEVNNITTKLPANLAAGRIKARLPRTCRR